MAFKPLRAIVGLVAALASLYVIYGTFGTLLMVVKTDGLLLITTLSMNTSWKSTGTTAANNIDLWFSMIWVIGVALIVYTFLSAISSTDYDTGG